VLLFKTVGGMKTHMFIAAANIRVRISMAMMPWSPIMFRRPPARMGAISAGP